MLSFLSVALFATAALALPPAELVANGTSRIYRGCGSVKTPEQIAVAEAEFSSILGAKGLTLESFGQTSRVAGGSARLSRPINVYWHVIYASTSVSQGYISDSSIAAQINVLNQDYAASGISFQLAGTDRTQQSTWFNKANQQTSAQTAMKKQLRKGSAADLNVYTVAFNDGSGTLGYATFPSDYASNPSDDGVVIHYASLPGGSLAPYNLGRTLTHEGGHWLGLYHVFSDYGDCTKDYDKVGDTPDSKTPSYGCPTSKDTCPNAAGQDPWKNYMDYSDDSCMTQFSTGQGTRIAAQISTYRGLS